MKSSIYDYMNWPDIEELVYSESSNPHALLGAHMCRQGMLVQIFRPDAVEVSVSIAGKRKAYPCEKVDEAGYFAVLIPVKKLTAYVVNMENVKGHKIKYMDPYAFKGGLSAVRLKKLAAGDELEAYRYYGAHSMTVGGVEGVNFAVYAPHALRVSVIGDFNGQDGRIWQMKKDEDTGIFQIFIPEMKTCAYRYEVKFSNGVVAVKTDPYALQCQTSAPISSQMYEAEAYAWNDKNYLKERTLDTEQAMSICELSLVQYAKKVNKEKLVEEIAKRGYTHVELYAVTAFVQENPYETLSYFALAETIGNPKDLQEFVDLLHSHGIGVIMDWNVSFFGRSDFGLTWFDGSGLYESSPLHLQQHPDWNVANFNMHSPQVRGFLLSSAYMWMKEYHMDGFRVPEISSLLYLDYGRNPGEWITNIYGGNENLDAVDFFGQLKKLTEKERVLLIAQDSSAWRQVTGDVKEGALGFDYKWNDTWRDCLLQFLKQDPLFRKGAYGRLTEPMLYHYSENFLSEFSREAVGDGTLAEQMPGATDEEKIANLRLLLGILYTYPGKKMIYECAFDGVPSFFLDALQTFYKQNPAFYELDYYTEGFAWGDVSHADETVLSFKRVDKEGNTFLVIVHFTPVLRKDFAIGVADEGKYREVFNTDDKKFGGDGNLNKEIAKSVDEPVGDFEQSIVLTVAPLSVSVLAYEPYTDLEKEEIRIRKEAKRAKQEAEAVAREAKELEEAAKAEAQAAIEAEKRAKEAAKAALEAKEEAEKRAVAAAKMSESIDKKMREKLAELKKK